ncbi:unnamed protein product [Effrenium voratum]|nr:unnamed protein product [Effrenium voratum]|mmetsp:Transcript_136203/g.322737  ORF Transcript_136203/g.322737 Transcript_136203/m.322737 type:complete len:139 (+) Transcript_136203:61-477(+)
MAACWRIGKGSLEATDTMDHKEPLEADFPYSEITTRQQTEDSNMSIDDTWSPGSFHSYVASPAARMQDGKRQELDVFLSLVSSIDWQGVSMESRLEKLRLAAYCTCAAKEEWESRPHGHPHHHASQETVAGHRHPRSR